MVWERNGAAVLMCGLDGGVRWVAEKGRGWVGSRSENWRMLHPLCPRDKLNSSTHLPKTARAGPSFSWFWFPPKCVPIPPAEFSSPAFLRGFLLLV